MTDPRRGHLVPLRFDFAEPRSTCALVCSEVIAGDPVLHVFHEDDGTWQFLCGRDHSEIGPEGASLRCLECTVAGDLTLNEIADLLPGHSADRERPGGPWTRRDPHEDFIRDAVAEHGWSVQLVPAGDDGEPAFAYTIGLHETFGAAELITFGLRHEVMHAMLNLCGERVRAGEALPVGARIAGILDGYDVTLRDVRTLESFRRHVGYALWFYGGWEFPLRQLVWPDKGGRFPGERGAAPGLASQQPLLP